MNAHWQRRPPSFSQRFRQRSRWRVMRSGFRERNRCHVIELGSFAWQYHLEMLLIGTSPTYPRSHAAPHNGNISRLFRKDNNETHRSAVPNCLIEVFFICIFHYGHFRCRATGITGTEPNDRMLPTYSAYSNNARAGCCTVRLWRRKFQYEPAVSSRHSRHRGRNFGRRRARCERTDRHDLDHISACQRRGDHDSLLG